MSGSGGDERVNEAGGRLHNNLRISIIDPIVRNNKEKLLLPLMKRGGWRGGRKLEIYYTLNLQLVD